MRYYRPLLLQKLAIQVPGLEVLKLRLHRHLETVDQVQQHAHEFSQLLFYLGGHGKFVAAGRVWEAREGAVFLIPARMEHAFEEEAGRRPLCLVLDLKLRGVDRKRVAIGTCNQSDLRRVRAWLAELAPLHHDAEALSPLRMSGLVLELLDLLLQRVGRLEGRTPHGLAPVVQAVNRWIQKNGWNEFSRARVARELGYQADHLNRLMKQATGLTFGQWEDQVRLVQAKEWLLKQNSVLEAAQAVGFAEQNYFARWFRRQTGMTPTRFRRA